MSNIDCTIYGDCIETMDHLHKDGITVQTCVTSPPYFGLRSYLPNDHTDKLFEIGLELSPEEYVDRLVKVFQSVRNILSDDGTLWLNIGDSYSANRYYQSSSTKCGKAKVSFGCKPKDLIGIPWMLAFALRSDGWYLRQDIIWQKPNAMPESVHDRCTKSHEYLFLLSKSYKYYFDADAIKEDSVGKSSGKANSFCRENSKRGAPMVGQDYGTHRPARKDTHYDGDKRNRRSVWSVATTPYRGAHCAVFPKELVKHCIMAGSRVGDIVIDPFMGSGTTAEVAQNLDRHWIGCELNESYDDLQKERLK